MVPPGSLSLAASSPVRPTTCPKHASPLCCYACAPSSSTSLSLSARLPAITAQIGNSVLGKMNDGEMSKKRREGRGQEGGGGGGSRRACGGRGRAAG